MTDFTSPVPARGILGAIGKTPLVLLSPRTTPGGAQLFAKAEYTNPSGSVKDRMALYMVEDAERRGLLRPGGTIVENSSGNTGSALAMIAAIKGYKCIITMPDKMSTEKRLLMEAFGAKVVVTPTAVPPESEESYYSVARRLAREIEGAYFPDQYNNMMNVEAHYRTTGPEIWEQMNGKIDALVAGVGTGGTLSGTARFLKEKNPKLRVVAVDPIGSVFFDHFHKNPISTPQVYKVEGIGEDHLVKALDFSVVDDFVQVNDLQCFSTVRQLCREEGLFAGGSSGGAVFVARKIAEQMGKNARIVTILPDSGNRYLSKCYNDAWMREFGFLA